MGTCESITDLATAYGTTYDLWDAAKSFACKCDPGFTGPSCADRLCPYGADPLTNADYEDANNINKNSNDIRNAHVATLHIDLSTNELGTIGSLDPKEYVELTYTDLFGETWTTTPIKHATIAALTVSGTLDGTDAGTASTVIAGSAPANVAAGWYIIIGSDTRRVASISGSTAAATTSWSCTPATPPGLLHVPATLSQTQTTRTPFVLPANAPAAVSVTQPPVCASASRGTPGTIAASRMLLPRKCCEWRLRLNSYVRM